MTDLSQWGASLGRGDERYRLAFELAPFGMAIMDSHGVLLELNDAWAGIVGYTRDELLGRNAADLLLSTADRRSNTIEFAEDQLAASRDHTIKLEVQITRRDGTEVWVRTESTVTITEEGHNECVVNMLFDISEHKQLESELEHQATHDPLTGLANRVVAHAALTQALAAPDVMPGRVAVLFVDLDRFKEVNDSLGHDHGDELLRVVAERMRRAVRDTDLVARYAGDEFVVLCRTVDDDGEALALARRVVDALEETFVLRGHHVHIGASVGVALNEAEDHPSTLFNKADAAMYRAKLAGRGRACVYTSSDTSPETPSDTSSA